MSLLSRFFARGRLATPPPGHVGGAGNLPASVQRSQMGLRAIDRQRGVVTLDSGEVRAFLRVSGVPLHHRSPEAAHAFLVSWAQALNALPLGVTLLVRSRPGGLRRYLQAKHRRAAELTARSEHTGSTALATLAADQLAHAARLNQEQTRQTDCYLACRARTGDVAALLADVVRSRHLLEPLGLRCELVTQEALLTVLSESWQPPRPERWLVAQAGGERLVSYQGPGGSVVEPVPTPPMPKAVPGVPALNGHSNGHLNGHARKALTG